MSHTPGEWIVHEEPRQVRDSGDELIADVDGRTDKVAEANTRLIAAAPDMAELIKGYETWEADLILSDEAWGGGMASLPRLTQPLWDRLLELQAMRNAVSQKITGTPAPTQADRLAALGRHPSNSPFAMQRT